jgi:hypothetical protein
LPAATLTPGTGATTVGTMGVHFTASAAVFSAGDVGKQIENLELNGTGKATITSFTSTTEVAGTIAVAFDDTNTIANQAWRLAGEFGGSPLGCGLPKFCDNHEDCILKLGIAGEQGKCSDLFPAGTALVPQVPGLLADQVLVFSETIQGPNCGPDNQVLSMGLLETTRYCSGGAFGNALDSPPGSLAPPVDCTPTSSTFLNGLGNAVSAIPIGVTFAPTSLNINCGTNNNDTWHFTFTASQHLTDLTRIIPSSLAVEGVSGEATCDTVTPTATTRTCHISACQTNPAVLDVATVVCNSNPQGKADLTVTGLVTDLDPQNPPIPIFGEDLGHKTTGQCRPL